MEHRDNEDHRETARNGRKRDRQPPEVVPGKSWADRDGEGREVVRGLRPERRDDASWVNWQSALYAFVLGVVSLVLAPLTSLWWIVPVLGAVVPLALAALQRSDLRSGKHEDKKARERELLEALAGRGELTPTAAAMCTALTVDEASQMLDELAGKGHLKVRAEGEVMTYALRGRDLPPAPGEIAGSFGPDGEASSDAPNRLVEPLSERELEVLNLLASGWTNSEVARDLFVSVGTVKSHTGNIYRKLGARNRAEAVTRARENRLLR